MVTVRIFAKLDYVARDGSVPLYLRLTTHRKVHPPVPLQLRCRPEHWDPDARQVKDSAPNAFKINSLLSRYLTRAQEILLDHELTGRPITYESFAKEFAGLSAYDFYDLAASYRHVNRGIFSDAYQQKVYHVVEKLRRFSPRLEVHQVDYLFLKQYQQHLITKLGNSKNTVHSNMRILRRIFSEGVRRDLVKSNPFDRFPLEKVKTEREILSLEELRTLESLLERDLAHYLHKALCWFLLAVYSGRRYQDLEDFYSWKFGTDHVKLEQQKRITGREQKKSHVVYMNARLRRICELIIARQYLPLSNQKANKYLKELCALAGIEKNITFHCARHTFASINKRLTGDLTVRRDLLGHDSIKSSLIYEHSSPEQIREVWLKWDAL